MRWIEISVGCEEDQVKAISALLAQYGHGGTASEEWAAADASHKHYLVKIYLPLSRAYRYLKADIESDMRNAGLLQQLHEKILQQDEWFESLKRDFKVMEIGRNFVIKPSWDTAVKDYPGKIIIEMDPGAAFGTGLHPTTRLCLVNLQKYLNTGRAVFDLGTGTGILAIAAVKLGAGSVLACDIDAVAVKAAKYNAKINRVEESIKFQRGTLSRTMQRKYRSYFDVVLANITSRAISDLAPALADIIKPQGTLIVSGIHPDGLDEVLIRLAMADLNLVKIEIEEGWHAVIAQKSNPPDGLQEVKS
jgi:ribosomal protein L11 methyltransferase